MLDVVLFFVVAGSNLQWVATAAAAGPSSLPVWIIGAFAMFVPLSIAVSLGAALLLDSKLARLKGTFRTALFAPVVTTVVAVAVIWRYLFHTCYGLIN